MHIGTQGFAVYCIDILFVCVILYIFSNSLKCTMQGFPKKWSIDSLLVITYDPLEVCGGVCLYRDTFSACIFLFYLSIAVLVTFLG